MIIPLIRIRYPNISHVPELCLGLQRSDHCTNTFKTPGHPPLLPTIGTQGDLHRHGEVLETGQILLGT